MTPPTKPSWINEIKRSEDPISPPERALHIGNGINKDGSTFAMFVRLNKSTSKYWFAELTTHSDHQSLAWLDDVRIFEDLTNQYDGVKWNDTVSTNGVLMKDKVYVACEAYKCLDGASQ